MIGGKVGVRREAVPGGVALRAAVEAPQKLDEGVSSLLFSLHPPQHQAEHIDLLSGPQRRAVIAVFEHIIRTFAVASHPEWMDDERAVVEYLRAIDDGE